MEVNMKKMKKKSAIAAVGMMSLWLAACGQTGGTGNVQTEPSAVETVQETQGSEAAPAVEETPGSADGGSCGAVCSGTDRNGRGAGGSFFGNAG